MYIERSLPMASTDLKFNADKGSFKGYASVWDGVDSYLDTIVKGAYTETLAKNGLPKMFYQHGHGMPIGKYTDAGEDSKGFWVEGELTPVQLMELKIEAGKIMDKKEDSFIIFTSRNPKWMEKEIIGREKNSTDNFL